VKSDSETRRRKKKQQQQLNIFQLLGKETHSTICMQVRISRSRLPRFEKLIIYNWLATKKLKKKLRLFSAQEQTNLPPIRKTAAFVSPHQIVAQTQTEHFVHPNLQSNFFLAVFEFGHPVAGAPQDEDHLSEEQQELQQKKNIKKKKKKKKFIFNF
jgi:hypothetical protein